MDLEPNDIGGPSDRAKFVELLMRSIRTGALYSPGHPKRLDTIERAHAALTPIFEVSSSLCFEMTAGGFRVQNDVIDTDDARELGRRISVGGLALLELTRGISVEELDALTTYISLDLENMRLEDDLVTLLWEVEWHNVRWEAVEVPTTPVDDEPSSYDSTVGIADEPTPAPLTSDDFPLDDFAVLDEERASLDEEVAANLGDPPPEQVAEVLCQLVRLEKNPEHFGRTIEMLRSVVDMLLRAGRFQVARGTLRLLDESRHDRKSMTEEKNRAIGEFRAAFASLQTLETIRPVMESEGWDDPSAVVAFFTDLPSAMAPHLLNFLLALEHPPARDLIRQALSSHLRSDMSCVQEQLPELDGDALYEVVWLLREVGTKDGVPILKQAMPLGGVELRMEIIAALETIGGAHARSILLRALSDASGEIRARAVRALPIIGRREALEPLLKEMLRSDFRQRDFEERKAFFRALGDIDMPEVLPLLKRLLLQKSWWRRATLKEDRECAAIGLLAMSNPEAVALRNDLARNGPRPVRELLTGHHAEAEAA